MPPIGDLSAVLTRIRGEFFEMPGLRITASEAERLWRLPHDLCGRALERLVLERFLRQTPDGRFVRNGPSA